MDWIELLRCTIDYIEAHLLDPISAEDIARNLNMSSFYLQKGFRLMTGYSIGEYIRNRRLYLAALDLLEDDKKVIDLAFLYGYETPESFTKAFRRFHGVSPVQIKTQGYKMKQFLPLNIQISVSGGSKLTVTIEKMEAMEVVGIERRFPYDKAYELIPKLWAEYCESTMQKLCRNLPDCHIGMYGISMEEEEDRKEFRYLIAGEYHGEEIPEGLKVVKIPGFLWAKFQSIGPMPSSIQSLNTRIFKEWLPGNPEYSIVAGYNIEMYSLGDTKAKDYISEIWIPVKRKN
ncbi:MAG: AraC family transcriptional regulator [Lachnospiraceae bacterium]|nr:AraC family transcriptional regulator [Lachnospiraceae bacterium]